MSAKKLTEKIEAIENDLDNGSTTIAKNAIDVFSFAVEIYSNNPEKIKEAAQRIKKAKPSMAALQNMIERCLKELSKMKKPYDFNNIANELKNDMDRETNEIIKKAAELLLKNNKSLRIITASYSSTVIKLFSEINKKNIPIKIYALESIWQERDHGKSVLNKCSKFDIPSQYIKLDELKTIIDSVDVAVTGADSFQENGSAVNGIPSFKLSKKCSYKIPFYVLAESYKKNNEAIIEDGFELIPDQYIAKIITGNKFTHF